MNREFYRWQGQTLHLRVLVQPRARSDQIVGPHGDRLKIRISAPPVDGKANSHLLEYLCHCFGVPRKHVLLRRGESGRHKEIHITAPQKLPAAILPAPQ